MRGVYSLYQEYVDYNLLSTKIDMGISDLVKRYQKLAKTAKQN